MYQVHGSNRLLLQLQMPEQRLAQLQQQFQRQLQRLRQFLQKQLLLLQLLKPQLPLHVLAKEKAKEKDLKATNIKAEMMERACQVFPIASAVECL
jgi:septum formation inhibitor MinC